MTGGIQGANIHYAVLPKPQKGDLPVVRNGGQTAIDVHIAASNQSDVAVRPVSPAAPATDWSVAQARRARRAMWVIRGQVIPEMMRR